MPREGDMSLKSDNFPLVLTGGTVGLWLLLHKIFDIFFEDWIKHQLEPRVGHTVLPIVGQSADRDIVKHGLWDYGGS
jgi:hypothetical protein